MRFLTSSQMRDWDRSAIDRHGIPGITLMRRAASAVAWTVCQVAAARGTRRVMLAAGRGNNGGDAIMAARLLHRQGLCVELLLTAPAAELRGEAADAWRETLPSGVPVQVLDDEEAWSRLIDSGEPLDGVLVDGLLGTGASGEPRGTVAAAIRWLLCARRRGAVVAVDVPSGLSADTGEAAGVCVRADVTVTFGAPKVGFARLSARDFLGHVEVADIGLPEDARPESTENVRLMGTPVLSPLLPRRPRTSHKGSFGHVLVIGGAHGFNGAPALTALGAARSGAGLVTAALPADSLPALARVAPSVMACPVGLHHGSMSRQALAASLVRPPELFDVVAAGPGLSASAAAADLVVGLRDAPIKRLVLDADALNVLAGEPESLRRAGSPSGDPSVIITPHPGEAARLLGCRTADIQNNREEAVRQLATRAGAVAVLKGSGTLVCAPGGHPSLNLTGNPGMATGGSGDVLAGLIAGLWAQGLSACDAARVGVYLHGTAGDLAAWRQGERGLTAEAIGAEIPRAFQWLHA